MASEASDGALTQAVMSKIGAVAKECSGIDGAGGGRISLIADFVERAMDAAKACQAEYDEATRPADDHPPVGALALQN